MRAREVCALTGATYRQLKYWDTTGLVVPSIRPGAGSGSVALYAPTDVPVVRLAVAISATALVNRPGGGGLAYLRGLPADLGPDDGYVVVTRHHLTVVGAADLLDACAAEAAAIVVPVAHLRGDR